MIRAHADRSGKATWQRWQILHFRGKLLVCEPVSNLLNAGQETGTARLEADATILRRGASL